MRRCPVEPGGGPIPKLLHAYHGADHLRLFHAAGGAGLPRP